MPLKEKTIGLIIIILGVLPFLLKIQSIANVFTKYKILSIFSPGEAGYQILIILFGALLIWTIKPKVETRR